MSKLALISAARMTKLLARLGFEFVRQQASHAYYRHPDGRATVVPMHKGENLRRGLIRAILNDVGISPDEYEKLRRQF